MKKKIPGILAALLAVSLVSGCAGGGTSSGSTAPGAASPAGDAKTNEKAEEISCMVWDRGDAAPNTTNEDNALTQWIQEQVLAEKNVKVRYVIVPRSGSDDKINVMMSGGNAPDIILTYTRNMLGDYAAKGGLTDLGPSIEKFGDNLKKELAETLPVGYMSDAQYAIPARRNVQKVKHMGYIRKDWLDALGLAEPTSNKELMDALYQFKEKDPGQLGAKNIPWLMGGTQDSEKYYMNFIASYTKWENPEKDELVYAENYGAIAPGTKEGFVEMNKMYNDGIISPDFAVDTNDDKYKQDIVNAGGGFFVDDTMRPMDADWLGTMQENNATAQFVPLTAFKTETGTYKAKADPVYGAYIMVPKTSEKKADACVKYLDWLSVTDHAMQVALTPEFTRDENGIPVTLTREERFAKKYPGTPNDLCIVTQFWDYHNDREKVIAEWVGSPWKGEFTAEYYGKLYDAAKQGLFVDPAKEVVLEAETKYSNNLKKSFNEFAYKVISASTADFEKTYATEYAKLMEGGLQAVLDERAKYYDTYVKK